MSFNQSVSGSGENMPDGFVPLASFGGRDWRTGKPPSDEYRLILDAYQRGKIDAVKVMRTPRDKSGPVFVNAAQAHLLIEEQRRFIASETPKPSAVVGNAATVAHLLERIAYALECIREAMPQRESSWNNG
jgi:hypothetical protein